MVTTLFVVVFAVWFFGVVYFSIRNEQVYRFRRNVLVQIRNAAHEDVNNGFDPSWRFLYFDNSASYEEMLWSFRKLTIENWYPAPSVFLPTQVNPLDHEYLVYPLAIEDHTIATGSLEAVLQKEEEGQDKT